MSTYLRTTGAIIAALVICGCAATSPNVSSKPAASAASAASASAANPNCLAYTGSNITPAKSDCRAFGRSYSSADIERTGRNSAGDALAQLDPSITVHR
jgi:hypothetical protein